ncbi:hypothetical protein L7F22_024940 [Adiantum nelumboides]|nr:hypothetical protein [Adiantum nelumboides]
MEREVDDEGPNDIVLCACIRCKFQTRRRRRIAEEHKQKYGAKDITQYTAWFEAQVQGQAHAHLDMTPDPRAASVHHKEARQQAMASVPGTSAATTGPLTGTEMDTEDMDEDSGFEEGIEDMLNNFFCDILSVEDVIADKEAKKRQEREDEIKEQCSKLLYEGARVSRLRVLLGLLNLQTIYGWSDVSVTALFQLLQKILPEGNCMPESRNAAKKTLATLGHDYKSIHACPNDHVLFRRELAKEVHCPQCHASRYQEDVQGNKVPAKVLRHFPLIPRIKHMFRCKEIAGLMSWHAKNKSIDGMMRVPADSPAWKHIETKWPWFERESRHLRLGLGTNGVNPLGLRSTKWSIWPVVLVNYNIPPWMSIKIGHLILSLLIPGKKKIKDMSVYLAPLIEELQDLWTGIKVVDNSRKGRRKVFNARAILMWTMHDYPGYGDVFYYPMHGDTNWKYVIDVAPRATQVLQYTQELSTIDDVNRILDDNDDDTSEEGGSFLDAKLDYSSTSTASEFENSFLNAFELDTDTDEINTFSHSSIGLNLEIVLEMIMKIYTLI